MAELKSPEYYEQFKIKEYNNFSLFLHESQYYLGRCYLHLNRSDIVDLHDMNMLELFEWRHISIEAKKALRKVFSPDRFNDASLGNVYDHLHIHLIPRYSTPRQFAGITFNDANWGKNYAPYDKNFKVPLETLIQIKDTIADSLNKA